MLKSTDAVMRQLARFPRVELAQPSTPLDTLDSLTRLIDGPRIYAKRDDCTGLAMGGNKARQLEYHFGEAIAEKADTVISTSGTQSNHLRLTAAAACKLGMACEIQRENRVKGMDADYAISGNVFLQNLFGAKIHTFPEGENEKGADEALERIADRLRSEGRRPYVIGLGMDYPPLGALGYVRAAREILEQVNEQGIKLDAVVLPTGSASTHAGTIVGLRALGSDARVFGICIRRDEVSQAERVWRRVQETADLIGMPNIVCRDDVWVTDAYLGESYGRPSPETMEAIFTTARCEGLLLDPVYTGKTMAGLIDLSKRGVLKHNWSVVFLHTGGTPALFAYRSLFDESGGQIAPKPGNSSDFA